MAVSERLAMPAAPTGQAWRSFKIGLWLGWQNESNWADPWLFFIYQVAKPVASSLILLVIYMVVAGTDTGTPLFAYLYLGNAFFTYVAVVAAGTAWVIMEDREFFRMAKYLALSPVSYFWYMAGRAGARILIATISVLILLVFGIWALGIPVHAATVRWEVFLPGFLLGLLICFATGLALAATLLVLPRKGPSAMEAVSGLIYLLAGVVFPLEVLPRWLQAPAYALPFTYWMEAIRRGLVGGGMNQSLAGLSDQGILLRLALMTAVLMAAAYAYWRWCEATVRDKGLIDATHEW